MIIEKDSRTEGVVILRISGMVKLGESTEFLMSAVDAIEKRESRNIVIDLGEIDYVDSTGLGELVGAYAEWIRHNREIRLSSVPPRVMTLLRMARIPETHVFANEKKAATSFTTTTSSTQ